MRIIDWYVGVPVCYLLALYESVCSLFPRRRGDVKNILFIKFFGLGSIVLSAPAVAAARGEFSGAKIHYLTFASNREVLTMLGCADAVYCIETKSLRAFITSTLRAIMALRRANIDIVFDIEFFAKFPLIIATLIGAKRKVGFYLMYESWRQRLLDDLGYYNHYWHVKDIFMSLVYLVKEQDPYYLRFGNYIRQYTLPGYLPEQNTIEKVKAALHANGWKEGQRLILLNPNAAKDLAPTLKRWQSDKWAALAVRLEQQYPGALTVFTGAPAEAQFVEEIISLIPADTRAQVRNSAGRFSLPELAGLFTLGDIFITIDSGPMHLAALTDIPILGLFFAETPALYGPLSKNARVVSPPLYSIPSFTVYMGKDPIVPPQSTIAELVTVGEVFSAALLLLGANQNKEAHATIS